MFIALKYKETNIVEYVLYMWHIEELIRSFNMDMALIEENVISKFQVDDEAKEKVRQWYRDLIQTMRQEGTVEKGHLSELNELMVELTYLHQSLLTVYQDKEYQKLVADAHPNLDELKSKGMGQSKSEVETAMNGLFGVLVLKLKQKQVSEATQEAIKSISAMMAHLAKQYKKMKEGALALPRVMDN